MEDTSLLKTLTDFFLNNILGVLIVFAVASLLQRTSNKFIGRLVERTVRKDQFVSEHDEKAREDTLKSIFSATATIFIWVVSIMIILGQFDVNLGPLIASAGIAGIAIGFGAQSLVKDIVTGTFILLESQFRVGDVIELNKEVSGTVEAFTLRITTLRDLDGMKHYIPNGEITLVTNMTMEFSGINLNIGVAYNTDIDKLEKVINTVGSKLVEEEEWSLKITEAPAFLRVDSFADSAIIVKIVGKTVPMEQWAVTGELRKRLKIAFDKEGIEIPFPQHVIHDAKAKIPTPKK
jgi:small conductance mechanosensitive channel